MNKQQRKINLYDPSMLLAPLACSYTNVAGFIDNRKVAVPVLNLKRLTFNNMIMNDVKTVCLAGAMFRCVIKKLKKFAQQIPMALF